MWNNLGGEIMKFGASLQRTATSSETIWLGQAATAARTRLNDLVNWCAQTGRGMQHMGTTVMRTQGEAAETAQRSMPAPVPYDPLVYQNWLNATQGTRGDHPVPGAEVVTRVPPIALGPVESRNFMVELASQFAAKPDEE